MSHNETKEQFSEVLYQALDHELTVSCVYSHYADALRGKDRVLLRSLFQEEALESMTHASMVRTILLDGGHSPAVLPEDNEYAEPLSNPSFDEILRLALELEEKAAELYRKALDLMETGNFGDLQTKDSLEQILIEEQKSVQEFQRLLSL